MTPTVITTTRRGFTILELMVVVLVVSVILGVLYPVIWAIERTSRASAGVNTISSAVSAVRAYALQDKANLDPPISGASFSGAAILFTPADELRLVENDQSASDGSNQPLEFTSKNGYVDIADLEYIKLPKGTGVVGIAKPSGTGSLIPPPFAVRFDENGVLIAGVNAGSDRVVYYDGNHDNTYTITSVRPSPFDPDPYDPDSSEWDSNNWDSTEKKIRLPFEEIETVIGVLVYSKGDFEGAELDWGTSSFTDVSNWLLEAGTASGLKNSRAVFFSRYSGTVLREGKP